MPGFSGLTGDQATFNGAAGLNVDLGNSSPSIAGLTFGPSALNYAIKSTGSGVLQLNNGGSNATITVSAGSQTISAPVQLVSNTVIDPAASAVLTISGGDQRRGCIDRRTRRGRSFSAERTGYTGGTTVAAGTLVIANPSAIADGTSLTVGAARPVSSLRPQTRLPRRSCRLRRPRSPARRRGRHVRRCFQLYDCNDCRAGRHERGFVEPGIVNVNNGSSFGFRQCRYDGFAGSGCVCWHVGAIAAGNCGPTGRLAAVAVSAISARYRVTHTRCGSGSLGVNRGEALTPGPSPSGRGERFALTPGPSPKGRGELRGLAGADCEQFGWTG